MTAVGAVNLFVPLSAVPGLSVPPRAITDGSPDPVWVDLPCQGGYLYGRRHMLRLPFDAAGAQVARRWGPLERRRRTVLTPVHLVLLCGALATSLTDRYDGLRLALYAALVVLQLVVLRLEGRATVAQHPQLVGRLGVYLPWVSAVAAREWLQDNPQVRVVPERPQWRRFRPPVYRWAAGCCAVAAVGVWWVALRDATFGMAALFAFLVLLGGSVVLGLKAVRPGFIRFGETERWR